MVYGGITTHVAGTDTTFIINYFGQLTDGEKK